MRSEPGPSQDVALQSLSNCLLWALEEPKQSRGHLVMFQKSSLRLACRIRSDAGQSVRNSGLEAVWPIALDGARVLAPEKSLTTLRIQDQAVSAITSFLCTHSALMLLTQYLHCCAA